MLQNEETVLGELDQQDKSQSMDLNDPVTPQEIAMREITCQPDAVNQLCSTPKKRADSERWRLKRLELKEKHPLVAAAKRKQDAKRKRNAYTEKKKLLEVDGRGQKGGGLDNADPVRSAEKKRLKASRQRQQRRELEERDPLASAKKRQQNADRMRKSRSEKMGKVGSSRSNLFDSTTTDTSDSIGQLLDFNDPVTPQEVEMSEQTCQPDAVNQLCAPLRRRAVSERWRLKRLELKEKHPLVAAAKRKQDAKRKRIAYTQKKKLLEVDGRGQKGGGLENADPVRSAEKKRLEASRKRKQRREVEKRDPLASAKKRQQNAERMRNAKSRKMINLRLCRRKLFQNTDVDSNKTARIEDATSLELSIMNCHASLATSTITVCYMPRKKLPSYLKTFFKNIKEGPTLICSCCGGLFYNKGISKRQLDVSKELTSLILNVDQQDHKLCITCKASVTKKKVPRLALSNGLDFPKIPLELKELSHLEQRLVAPRIPFMQIRLLGFEEQWSLRGNVVNVENDLDFVVRSLPRRFNETSVVQLKLMRRMQYKRPYIYEKIRPAVVVSAINVLLKSPLYVKHAVMLSENWNTFNTDEVDFIVDDGADASVESDGQNIEQNLEENETIVELLDNNSGETGEVDDDQTFLFQDDFASIGIKIAPAEGKTPVPLFRDPDAELLSFPKIYCGQPRSFKVKLSYTEVAKSEVRRYDRRCATAEKVLYSFKKSFNEKVHDAYQIAVRQKPASYQGERITAGTLKNKSTIHNLIARDDGYAVFKNVRSTPAYWKQQSKKVVGMVRQLGPCSFFLTLSAAETRWGELLVTLSRLLDNRILTEVEALQLDPKEKARLIRCDPVTCMRHFDHKYRELLNVLMKKEDGIFEPHGIADWYIRIEFQARGSPHCHGLYWLKNAPTYKTGDEKSKEECIKFIDQFITCKKDEDGELTDLIKYQIHRHTHTCKKKKRNVRQCRFNYPKPPLPVTMILEPLPADISPDELARLKQVYTTVEQQLNTWGRGFNDDISVQDMLTIIKLNMNDYIPSIRSTIKRTTVFLKRQPKEAFINAYNRDILLAWRANMDLQYVLDGYACAKYVASYISKSGGGVSKLLQAAAADVNDGNVRIMNKVKKFGTILISGSEIGAQEAAAFILGIPMTNSSRSDVFINTLVSCQRVRMVKPKEDLEILPDESDDIYIKGASNRYSKRPDNMENICFAEFVSSWRPIGGKRSSCHVNIDEGSISHTNADSDNDDDDNIFAEEEVEYIRCNKAKILRFCNFGRVTSPNDYWREQLLLFTPWRDETRDIEEIGDYEIEARNQEGIIIANSREYYHCRKNITTLNSAGVDTSYEVACEDSDDDVTNNGSNVPDNEIANAEEYHEYANETLTGKKGKTLEKFLPPKIVPATDYLRIMRSLNKLQRRFVMEIFHRVKTSDVPFHIFLSGGAGVGKSHVITSIVQSIMRFRNRQQEGSPESLPVIVCAPTGKAAFNVFGMTIHNVFRLPPSQHPGEIAPLEESIANCLRVRYRETILFIIDEISMVGAIQLLHIDSRLRQLFDKSKPFGGKSILAVGHLRQLPPVAMKHIFKCPELKGRESTRSNLVSRNPLWTLFRYFELTEIMRQKDAHAFCKSLNNMSEGRMDDDDIRLIRSREVAEVDAPTDAVWLFRTNSECDRYNARLHATLGTESIISHAVDIVTGNGTEWEKRNLEAAAKSLTRQESDGLNATVNLQVGGIYFVTTNIDVADGLFNGATGILEAIEYDNNGLPVSAWIHFCHPSIGQSVRSTACYHQRCVKKNFPDSWTPIDRMSRLLKRTFNGMHITRKQIPLQAANGMTIAKSQGSSLPKVVVCIKENLSRENLYVACSRATSLEGFFIVGQFRPPKLADSTDSVSKEMEILKTIPIIFSLPFAEDIIGNHSLYYHNVEGFLLHKQDILADPNIMRHDYLVFVEPRIAPSHKLSLNGYHLAVRVNSSSNQVSNSEGILLFVKDTAIDPVDIQVSTDKDGGSHCILLAGKIDDIRFITVYRHPKYPRSKLVNILRHKIDNQNDKMFIVGDMNVDVKDPKNESFINAFGDLHFDICLPRTTSTTEYNTHIDVCFANTPGIVANIHETYYSYHKGISIIHGNYNL